MTIQELTQYLREFVHFSDSKGFTLSFISDSTLLVNRDEIDKIQIEIIGSEDDSLWLKHNYRFGTNNLLIEFVDAYALEKGFRLFDQYDDRIFGPFKPVP